MQVRAAAWCRVSTGTRDCEQRGASSVGSTGLTGRNAVHLVVLILTGVALSACVGVRDGYHQQPYGTYTGDARFTAPYAYRQGSTPYLYNQAQASWPRTYTRADQGNYRNRHNRPGHDNRRNF